MITYRYLSDGTKISAEAVLEPEADEGDGYAPARIYRRRYKGNFTYVTDPDTGEETLESISWREGRITIATEPEPALPVEDQSMMKVLRRSAPDPEIDTSGCGPGVVDTLARVFVWRDEWHVTDHLGNVRVVVNLNGPVDSSLIVEQNDYLPFGTRFTPATQGVVDSADQDWYGFDWDNRYRYAGKEEQRFGPQIDLGLLDFGARSYDPFTARWTSVDPLAHKYLGLTPYNYCGGNPVMYFDPDGRKIVIGSYSRQFAHDLGQSIPCLRKEDAYLDKVSYHLTQLQEMDTLLDDAIKLIDNSNIPYLILPTSERGVEKGNGYSSMRNIIYYDPDNDNSPLPNENKRDPKVALAHELGHAQNDENGTRTPVNLQDKKDLLGDRGPEKKEIAIEKINKNESNSIRLENVARYHLNLDARSYNYLEGVIK